MNVRVPLKGIIATTPQDAARLATERFDWDTHHWQAEFVDEVREFLVDVEGAVDHSKSRRFHRDFEPMER